MRGSCSRAFGRVVAHLVAMTMVVSGVTVATSSVAEGQELEPPDWLDDLGPATSEDDPIAPPWQSDHPSPLAESVGVEPAEVRWPSAGSSTVTLPGDGESARARGGLVEVVPSTTAARGIRVKVEVLDQAFAERIGVPGFLMKVTGVGEPITKVGDAEGLPLDLSIDYSGFEFAYGAGYADRLRLVALPTCALQQPRPAGCEADGVTLQSRIDAENKRLIAVTDDLGDLVSTRDGSSVIADVDVDGAATDATQTADESDGSVVLAVMSGPEGETGDFSATPLSVSGAWQVAPGSGEFSWTYPMTVPAPPAGAPPEVGLSYSAGAVDGMVSTGNTQSPMTGVGWSGLAGGFVERRYERCDDTGDLCWRSDNALISLNGQASELLKHTDGTWRLKSDPHWKVERLTGANNGDNDGEHWKVTTPDGVQYFFGLGRNPDVSSQVTSSTWWVPVVADDAGEPCRGANNTLGACRQGWRWNLDRVVDPNGNTTTYVYARGTNHYRALGGLGSHHEPYIKGGALVRIEYGKPVGTGSGVSPAGRVVFETQYRCGFLVDNCPAPVRGSTSYYDVPTDLMCASSEDCLVTSPTFFVASRYKAVRTEVFVAGAWKQVDQWNLLHTFLQNDDGHRKLYLIGIQRVGLSESGTMLPLPRVDFTHAERPNRVDVNLSAGKKPMGHFRVTRIVDEYGAETRVTYGQPNKCPSNYQPRWDENTKDCFPQKVRDRWGVFHKYLTTRVDEVDPTGGSPTVTTTYTYEGAPAWHYENDVMASPGDQSFSDWRGYASVRVQQGTADTRIQVFRGMHEDRMCLANQSCSFPTSWPWTLVPPLARRTASVTTSDGRTFADDNWMAGAILEEENLAPSGPPLRKTLYEYEARTTRDSTDPLRRGVWVGEAAVTTSHLKTASGPVYEQQRTTMTYNGDHQLRTELEEGWLSRTGDERCTFMTYARNPAKWMFAYPAGELRTAGTACTTGPMLSASWTYYDGTTVSGAAPTRGNPTMQQVRLDASTAVTTSTMTYDSYGRVMDVTDAAGLLTQTRHEATPNGGFPRHTIVTENVGSRVHQTTTQWEVGRAEPRLEIDPNGKITSYQYDGLGRLVGVRLPTELASSEPRSVEYAYLVDDEKDAVPIVRTRELQSVSGSNPTYVDSWVLYDSFLRERQQQSLSPTAGKVFLIETTYDNQGRVRDATQPQAVTGTPGRGLLSVTWDNTTRTSYDTLGQPVKEAWFRGSSEAWATTSSYTHDTVTVTPPVGGRTRTQVDGLGRTTRVEEHDGTAWRVTSYGYDLADNLTSVTDPAGNRATYTYNMVGWRLSMDDPDAGLWTYGYDDAGRQTRVTDAKGGVIHASYDVLGRPLERRKDSPTGPVLARWAYDAPGEMGRLDKATRVTPQGDWVVDTTGYDDRGRPLGTKWTVPAGVPGLSGSYTVSYGYDRSDHMTSISYPAVGGLPAETVQTRYNSVGLPEAMNGAEAYVWSVLYDDRARPNVVGYGSREGGTSAWMNQGFTYDADQRPSDVWTVVNTSGQVASRQQLRYDAVGNVTERRTSLAGTPSWRECFGYDQRNRLTTAYTVALGSTCADGEPGTGGQPYNHTYRYSIDGNLVERTENGVREAYTYPEAGEDRPHAPTAVGGDSYYWDANGQLGARSVDGNGEYLIWDAERRLSAVVGANGTTSFLYDADGARLLRTTPDSRTFYFAGHEVTANLSGSSVKAVRSYSFDDGGVVATRSSTGVDYLVGDQQGSVEAVVAQGGGVEATRAYEPYGQERYRQGETDTDRSWVGQIRDGSTDLMFLNARYYDPNIGRFISTDALFDTSRPQTLNPYTYGMSNPTTFGDPTGLISCTPSECGSRGRLRDLQRASGTPRCTPSECGARRAAQDSAHRASVRKAARKLESYVAENERRAQRRREIANLRRMSQANPNPAFWKALAAAGSGEALTLTAMRIANPDPGFWKALSKAGAARLRRIAGDMGRAARQAVDNGVLPPMHGWTGRADCCPNPFEPIVEAAEEIVDGVGCLASMGPHGCKDHEVDYDADDVEARYCGGATVGGFGTGIWGAVTRATKTVVARVTVTVLVSTAPCLPGAVEVVIKGT